MSCNNYFPPDCLPSSVCCALSVYTANEGGEVGANGQWTQKPPVEEWVECYETSGVTYLQFKKSTDATWITMWDSTTPLYTHESNPQYPQGDGWDSALWTIHVGAGAGGFTWNIRTWVIDTAYYSPTQNLVVDAAVAAAPKQWSLAPHLIRFGKEGTSGVLRLIERMRRTASGLYVAPRPRILRPLPAALAPRFEDAAVPALRAATR